MRWWGSVKNGKSRSKPSRRLPGGRGPRPTGIRNTWYQPLEEQADIERAVHWVIGRPGIFLNTAGDIQLLPKILDAASRYEKRRNDEAMTAMLEKQYMTTLFGLGPQGIR